jgi:sugar lactone lactonase YvrE
MNYPKAIVFVGQRACARPSVVDQARASALTYLVDSNLRITSSRHALAVLSLLFLTSFLLAGEKPLFTATPLTAINSFTKGVEGPACDAAGNVYAVNFGAQQTIGKVTPDGKAEVFVTLPGKSVGNGIRFSSSGLMYVADYAAHQVLTIDPQTRAIAVYAKGPEMNQPNDLALAPDGTLFASDPDWKNQRGQIWRIATDGRVTRVAADMGTTNGIEVSPDGKFLYVNESVQRNVWAFEIAPDGSLAKKRLIKQFSDFGFDGMRCDIDGNLYITRHGKGTVVKMTPQGEVLKEIDVLGTSPTNICFGGLDGCTAYVTEAQQRRLVQFRVDRPGNEWRLGQNKSSASNSR